MSGFIENILCGFAVEVIKTCYVYGKKWVENYQNSDEHQQSEAVRMERIVNRLLNIKDFYIENWSRVPDKDRILLGRYLGRVHAVLSSSKLPDNLFLTITIENEAFTA